MKRFARFAALAFCVICCGCTPSISSKVTPEEYEVYAAWVKHRFEKDPPTKLYLGTQTFNDSQLLVQCGDTIHKKGNVSWALIKKLEAVGDARYPVKFDKQNMQIPRDFIQTDAFPPPGPRTFGFYYFTRVAFNRSHNEALFGVSNSCGSECGGGGMVAATKDNGHWIFRDAGCSWFD